MEEISCIPNGKRRKSTKIVDQVMQLSDVHSSSCDNEISFESSTSVDENQKGTRNMSKLLQFYMKRM